MTIPANPVKFVTYLSQAGYDNLDPKEEDTIYFVRETLRIYQGSYDYNEAVSVTSLPSTGIPLKIYLVNNKEVYFRTFDAWVHLNPEADEGGALEGIGITLNSKVIGGVKQSIESGDVLRIPENWQYIIQNSLSLDGVIYNDGEIFIN